MSPRIGRSQYVSPLPVGDAIIEWSIPVTWVTVHSEDIGNTFGPNGLLIGSSLAGLVVEIAQIVVHEGDEPDPLTDLCDPDVLPLKHLTF